MVVSADDDAPRPLGLDVEAWSSMLAATGPTPHADVQPDTLACLLYTSGTTGLSKGCMLPHNYLVCLSEQISNCWGADADDVVMTPLPLFHINALAVCAIGLLVRDYTVAVVRRFSVSNFWPEARRSGATIVSLLGSLATLIANAPDHHASPNHRLRLCAAVPMPATTDEAWRDRFGCPTFSAAYGMTEVVLIATLAPGEPSREHAAGRINVRVHDVRIVDDDDREVPVGTTGQVVTRPRWPNVMFQGYWQRPDATADTFRNLWFHTGDLARLDEHDYLYFEDRKQDYLRRRGENISSFEVERAILAHSEVVDVAVHSVPSEFGEDDVKATVVLRDRATVDEPGLGAWCDQRLPRFAFAPIHRVPLRSAAQCSRPRPQVPASCGRRDRRDLGPRAVRRPATVALTQERSISSDSGWRPAGANTPSTAAPIASTVHGVSVVARATGCHPFHNSRRRPMMRKTCPEMCDAASLARYATSGATLCALNGSSRSSVGAPFAAAASRVPRPRRDRVHRHAIRIELARHRQGERCDSALGGGVVGLPECAEQPCLGGRVDDPPDDAASTLVLCPPVSGHHARRGERSRELHLQYGVPVLGTHVERHPIAQDPRAVDQDVDSGRIGRARSRRSLVHRPRWRTSTAALSPSRRRRRSRRRRAQPESRRTANRRAPRQRR